MNTLIQRKLTKIDFERYRTIANFEQFRPFNIIWAIHIIVFLTFLSY